MESFIWAVEGAPLRAALNILCYSLQKVIVEEEGPIGIDTLNCINGHGDCYSNRHGRLERFEEEMSGSYGE